MSSVCMSKRVNDAGVIPMRATYVNLHKWPESDAEFVRRVSKGNRGDHNPRVMDSISCRQMYLRSYPLSVKKESVQQKTMKCLGKVKDRVVYRRKRKVTLNGGRKCSEIRKMKELSCAAFSKFFHKLMISCSGSVDVE